MFHWRPPSNQTALATHSGCANASVSATSGTCVCSSFEAASMPRNQQPFHLGLEQHPRQVRGPDSASGPSEPDERLDSVFGNPGLFGIRFSGKRQRICATGSHTQAAPDP
jgi:hypothetical protein